MNGSPSRAWGIAVVCGLALAAALIVVPRPLLFEPQARNACDERGDAYVGLTSGSGRYADPVPEGTRCLLPGDPATIEIGVDFFGSGAGGALVAWLYRLACLTLPIGAAYAIGRRLSRSV